MKLYAVLFLTVSLTLGEIFIYPKVKTKLKSKFTYISLYLCYVLLVSVVAAGINISEHGGVLTKQEIKQMVVVLITTPIEFSIIFLGLRNKLSVSSVFTIIFVFDAVYKFVAGRIEEGNMAILQLSVVLIYKMVKFIKQRKQCKNP